MGSHRIGHNGSDLAAIAAMSTALLGVKRCSKETSALVLTLEECVTVPWGGKTMHIGESEGLCEVVLDSRQVLESGTHMYIT